MVEKSRLVEAKVRISTMRQIAYSYYLENGTVDTMQPADFGIDNFLFAKQRFFGIINLSKIKGISGSSRRSIILQQIQL